MKVLYHYHSPDTQSLSLDGGKVIIYACKPTIINPGEIIKVPTNVSLKTEAGYYLCLTTHLSLVQKVCQIFSGTFIIDDKSSDKALEIPITNYGRNPVTLMIGQELASGRVIADVPIELESFLLNVESEKYSTKSTPQKKNTGVAFEMK